MKRRNLSLIVAAAVCGTVAPDALAQLRIVSLNGANTLASSDDSTGPRNPWMQTILTAIGSSVSDDPTLAGNTGIVKPIDILALQEVHSAATTAAAYASLLNTIYPGANYQWVNRNGTYTDSQPSTQGLVYNADAVTVVSHAVVGTASTSGQPRQALKYQLRPIGYDSSADIYIYNSHYKAGNQVTDEPRRLVEAQAIRTNADAMGAGKNIIYLGDMNVYTSSEDAYVHLLSAGNGQALDPINKPGDWANSSTFKNIHTQSPFSQSTATSVGSSFVGTLGGMDDRFDQQLITANLNDGNGVAYIANSYQAFGNSGTHTYNQPINTGSGNPQPANVLNALAAVLDHLPVVADYQLPAKQSVTVAAIPPQVITGASVSVNVTVSNSAPVSFAVGADVLDYSMTTTGNVSGSATSSDAALGGSNVHAVTLSTTGSGARSGTINVNSTSEAVANGSFSQNVNYTVLQHAAPSFSTSSDVAAQTIDFGYVPMDSATRMSAFTIANRAATNRAALDLDSINNSGDTARLSTTAAAFSNLAAGSANVYDAQLNSAVAGNSTATHTFNLLDENLPGATATAPLVLTTTARVFSAASFPVTGFIFLPVTEPLTTGPFSIGNNVALTKTGPGAMNISAAQSNGSASHLIINDGAVNFLTDAGPSASNLAVTVNVADGATFQATQHLSSLTITGGSASMTQNGSRVIDTATLSISSGGKLDLRDNNLIVRNAAASAISDYIKNGRNSGNWNGVDSIVTTMSAAQTPTLLTTLAIATATEAGRTNFAGESVAGDDVLVMYTYTGDANLSGHIDADDFFQIDANYNKPPASATYHRGDFNYDGVINGDDYGLIDAAFLGQTTRFIAAPPAGAVSAVPEPAAPLALLAISTLSRRRRRRGMAAPI